MGRASIDQPQCSQAKVRVGLDGAPGRGVHLTKLLLLAEGPLFSGRRGTSEHNGHIQRWAVRSSVTGIGRFHAVENRPGWSVRYSGSGSL